MAKKILVTGDTGFLSSHLCEKSLLQGNEVLYTDNYFTTNKNDIFQLLESPKFEITCHCLTSPIYAEVDEIDNVGGAYSDHYQFDLMHTIKTSVHGAFNLLGLAKRVKARILQVSTSEGYGDPEVHLQTENYWRQINPIGIRSCYDEGGRRAEILCLDNWRRYVLEIKVTRIFNTYRHRRRSKDGWVVRDFIIQALNGDNITIYGHEKQTRSFCNVVDLIVALIKTMDTRPAFKRPISIGNSEECSMLQFAYKIMQLTGSTSKIILPPTRSQDNPKQCQPNITSAERELTWWPIIKLEEGLKKISPILVN